MRLITILFVFLLLDVHAQDVAYNSAVITTYQNAQKAYQNGDFEQSKVLLEACIVQEPECFEAHLALGQLFYKEGHYIETLNQCEKASEIRPFNAPLIALSGKTHYQIGAYSAAKTFLKKAISLGDNSMENQQYLGLTLQKLSEFEDARYYFDLLINHKSDNSINWFNRGVLHIDMGNYEKALSDLTHALELSPENSKTCIHLAITHFKLDQPVKALVPISTGMKNATDLEKIDLYLLKGNYYRQIENFDSAAVCYELAFQIQQDNPIVLTHQAAVLIDLEDYDSAIEKCDLALVIEPEQTEAYFNRGIANEMSRNIESACNDWEQAFLLGSQKAIEYLNSPICND